jgi:fatty acid synthase
MKDIRSLTLTKLRNMAKAGKSKKAGGGGDVKEAPDELHRDDTFGYRFRIDFNSVRPENPCEKLNDVEQGTPLFFVHSIEGIGTTLISLAKQLPFPCYCFQQTPDAPTSSMEELAGYYLEKMKAVQPQGPYRIVGYSYGACIGLEMAFRLQAEFPDNPRIVDPLIMLDGSHHYMRLYRKAYRRFYNIHDDNNVANDPLFQTEILVNLLMRFAPLDYRNTREQFLAMSSIEERFSTMIEIMYASGHVKDREVINYGVHSYYNKMMMGDKYNPKQKFKGDITLIRAKTSAAKEEDVGKDYGLSEVTTGTVHVFAVEGDHDTFVHNESAVDCAKHIMNAINATHSTV